MVYKQLFVVWLIIQCFLNGYFDKAIGYTVYYWLAMNAKPAIDKEKAHYTNRIHWDCKNISSSQNTLNKLQGCAEI